MRRGPRATIALIAPAALAIVVGGCSLVYGPSSDEFSGGSKDGGGLSSSSGTSGASSSGEGGTSGTTPEGGASSSSSGGIDAPAFVCPSPALLCDDFEGGQVANAPFTLKGTETRLVAGGQSSANGFSSTYKNGKESYLQAFLGAHPHVELSFWFRVDGRPTSDPAIHFRIVDLLFGDGCDWELSWQAWIELGGLFSGTDAYDKDVNPSCGPIASDGAPLLTAAELFNGQWHHLVVDADSRDKTRKVVMTIDNAAPISRQVQTNTGRSSDSLQLDLGINCVQELSGCYAWSGDPYTVTYDQVTVTER